MGARRLCMGRGSQHLATVPANRPTCNAACRLLGQEPRGLTAWGTEKSVCLRGPGEAGGTRPPVGCGRGVRIQALLIHRLGAVAHDLPDEATGIGPQAPSFD